MTEEQEIRMHTLVIAMKNLSMNGFSVGSNNQDSMCISNLNLLYKVAEYYADYIRTGNHMEQCVNADTGEPFCACKS